MPLEIVGADPQGADALRLLAEAVAEAKALYPELHDPSAPPPTNPPTPSGGVFLLAIVHGRAVACGAFRPLGEGVVELRRMFVTRSARRRGVASAMLRSLEAQAAGLGVTRLRLETGYRQAPAIALYEQAGYRRIAPFGAYVDDPTSVCFEKTLA